jgi:hypothetical protein
MSNLKPLHSHRSGDCGHGGLRVIAKGVLPLMASTPCHAQSTPRASQNEQLPGSGKSVRIIGIVGVPTGTRNVTIVSATLPVSFLSM